MKTTALKIICLTASLFIFSACNKNLSEGNTAKGSHKFPSLFSNDSTWQYSRKTGEFYNPDGIRIVFNEVSFRKELDVRLTLITDFSEKIECLKMISFAIGQYPRSVVRDHLKVIYVFDTFSSGDQKINGLNATAGRIYLARKNNAGGFIPLFHDEFSSILLNRHLSFFNQKEWRDINSSDFEYYFGGDAWRGVVKKGLSKIHIEKISKKYSKMTVTEINQLGFLDAYSASQLENDFNSFARYAFTNSDIVSLCEKFPKLRAKYLLLTKFYKKLYSGYDEARFENCRKDFKYFIDRDADQAQTRLGE